MTSNDAHIDVLLRRYAGELQPVPATEHLDADELNAFAEGSLPAAARARYVSHLVDCDNCRQIVSQLAISSGAVLAEPAVVPGASGSAWWKRLSGLFPPLTLRYAAFAMVLIAAAGIVVLVMRRQPDSNLVAQNEQTNAAPASALKPAGNATPQAGGTTAPPAENEKDRQTLATQPGPDSKPSPNSEIAKLDDQPRPGDVAAAPPKPAKEGYQSTSPSLAASKKPESTMTEKAPSYAPPPPVQTQAAETQSRESQSTTGGVASVSGPRQSQQSVDKLKVEDRGRSQAGKDDRGEDNSRLAVNQPPASKRVSDEKTRGPRRDADNNVFMNRSTNDVSANPSKAAGTGGRAEAEAKQPETRSAGGRKFRRQGSSWVDTKFKSSMSLKSISRSSSEFAELDSGLRAIAQQLGGEAIVVWKGKAYLIK